MLCLACGADNPGEHRHCRRCQRPLVVPSAAASEEMGEWLAKDAPVSLDEHLLERVSVLEEALQRTAEGVARLAAAVAKLDRSILLGQAGAGTVFEMLEERGVVPEGACRGAWRDGLERELAAMELRERFAGARERVAAACDSAAARRLLGEAETALAVHDAEGALALFERALRREPGNLPLALFLAEAAFAGGDGSRALRLCEAILAREPRQLEALVYSGVLLHERGDLPAAEARLREALRRDRESFLARFALGSVLAARGRPRLAARQLEKALALREMPQARFLLGRCLHESGRPAEAIVHLRRAVAADPDLEEAHYLLGLASLDLGQRRRALASFRAAQRLNPRKLHYQDLVTFLSGRPTSPLPPVEGRPAEALAAGERLLARGDGRGALRAAGTALRLAPDHPTVLISYAMVCLALGRLPELETAARRALALASGDMLKATAAAALIAALRGAGRLREGNRVGRELLAGNPSSFAQTIAYYELAYNLAELEEDLDRALDYARRALDLAPEELRQFPLAALGWVHYKRREYAEAVDCLSRSSALGPSSTTLTHLGMALLAVGDEKRARGAFRRARSLEPRSGGLEERMMECMRSSSELAARVQERGERMTRWSEFYVHTTREVPSDAEVISHQLMVRAGLIKKLAAGIYTYLPLGWRSVAKMAAIVRREMDAAGAVELSMPAIQPAELWQESGRWQRYGKELLRMRDRHDREFCFGPTHEEVVTDLVRRDVRSYRQLPFNLYQIQTKFRDEIRPRFGLMRGREFLMKDAYSFGATEAQLDEAYEAMRRAYCAIFAACKLEYTMVEADTGTIGGSSSHEFMVVAQTGESAVVSCPCGYGANVEKAESRLAPAVAAEEAPEERRAVPTPGKSSVPDVAAFLGVPPERVVKTLIYETEKEFVAALVRGDREINEVKLQNALAADHLALASEEKVERLTGAALGFAGPIGLPAELRLIADESVRELRNFVCGANEADTHLVGVNWGRDLPLPPVADLLLVAAGDPCPRCGAPLQLSRGIEVGHIFKLGTKYSEAMRCHFTDETGAERPMIMGCYGLGIGRTVAAAIEQNHDADGIVWPLPLAPFEVLLVTLNAADEETRRVADELHARLGALGIEVLYDDRDERPGVKFKDADLVGIPLRVVVGGKSLAAGQVEISHRRDRAKEAVPVAEGLQSILARLAAEGRKTPA